MRLERPTANLTAPDLSEPRHKDAGRILTTILKSRLTMSVYFTPH
jgi:hypothetical protein